MKKTILAAISALALLAPTAMRADEPAKEYNMVITLQNGTTITLGHNDIKNITFNGEEISISGNVVNTIDQINNESMENRGHIANIYAMLEEYAKIVWVYDQLNELTARSEEKDAQLMGNVDLLKGDLQNVNAYLTSLADDISNLKTDIYSLMGRIEANSVSMDVLNNVVNNMQNSDADLKQQVNDLRDHIDHLYYIIDELRIQIGE